MPTLGDQSLSLAACDSHFSLPWGRADMVQSAIAGFSGLGTCPGLPIPAGTTSTRTASFSLHGISIWLALQALPFYSAWGLC